MIEDGFILHTRGDHNFVPCKSFTILTDTEVWVSPTKAKFWGWYWWKPVRNGPVEKVWLNPRDGVASIQPDAAYLTHTIQNLPGKILLWE